MNPWQPFVVVKKERQAPPGNSNTHVVVLRVKDCLDTEILEDTELNCYKEAQELNSKIRVSLNNFVEGK